MKKILSSSYIRSITFSGLQTMTGMIAAVTFVTYSLTGHLLSSSVVYFAIPLFNALRVNMGLMAPAAIMFGSESLISIKRIQVTNYTYIFWQCLLVSSYYAYMNVGYVSVNNHIGLYSFRRGRCQTDHETMTLTE